MTAYIVFLREGPIHNQAEIDEYQRISAENRGKFDIKPLTVYGAQTSLEGEAPDGIAILEFPSVEEAKAWYYSPVYQKAVPHRRNGGEYRGIIVEGFKMPGS